MKELAFCFLLYDKIVHQKLWEKYFSQASPDLYNIYAHTVKTTEKTPTWIKDNVVKRVDTGWCHEGLVLAFIEMLKEALKNPDNKYFVLLSGDCVPLYNFEETYKKITSSKKSRMNIETKTDPDGKKYYYAHQWVILNRDMAELYVKIENNLDFLNKVVYENYFDHDHCPDEMYPIYWFVKNLGAVSSTKFKKQILNNPPTYTKWEPNGDHPIKFNGPLSMKKKSSIKYNYRKIYDSDSIFARKFTKSALKWMNTKIKR
jgi:hypothetical protein